MPYRCYICGNEYDRRVAWCWGCVNSDTIVLKARRDPSLTRSKTVTTTARDMAGRQWNMVESCYPIRLLKGAFSLLYGSPNSGKSTMLIRWLDSVSGGVALLPTEEKLGPAVSERFARLNIRRSDFYLISGGSVDSICEEIKSNNVKAIGIDSLSASQLLPAEVRKIQSVLGLSWIVATLQVTKQGLPAGSNSWMHEADTVCHLDNLGWKVEKSRYENVGMSGSVLEN